MSSMTETAYQPVFNNQVIDPPAAEAEKDSEPRVIDEYGRDVTGWLEIDGKLRPHP